MTHNPQLLTQLNAAMTRGDNADPLPSLNARPKNANESPVQQATRLSRLASRFGIELKLDVEIVVATAREWYDKNIAPRDIPAVPNFVEPSLDQAIWWVCEYSIRWVYKALTPEQLKSFELPTKK